MTLVVGKDMATGGFSKSFVCEGGVWIKKERKKRGEG